MNNKLNLNDIPFIVAYLGGATYHQLAKFLDEKDVKIFNQLEKLVGKDKLIMRMENGEIVYEYNYLRDKIKGYKFGSLEKLK
jgi:pyruvate/oxaloacetate carboxyltransferase